MGLKLSQLVHAYKDTIVQDPDIHNLSTTEFGDRLYVYANEDMNRLGEVNYPYVHLSGINRQYSQEGTNFVIVASFSALIENTHLVFDDKSSINITDTKLEEVIAETLSVLRDETLSGISGESGLEIVSTNEVVIRQDGQDDILHVVEIDIFQKNC